MYKGNKIDQFNITKKVAGSGTIISDGFIDRDSPVVE
jgi:hypothetical protein